MHAQQIHYAPTLSLASSKVQRLAAIDLQRGLIMLIMAFSHCREYVGATHYNNNQWGTSSAWLGSSWVDIFEQIFVATVASGFFMLMGVSIILLCETRLRAGWSIEKICTYLIKRGSVLILLQLTVLQIFEFIAEQQIYFYAGVIMTLGACMILAALTLYGIYKLKAWCATTSRWLDYLIPLTLMTSIILLLQFFMNNLIVTHAHPSWLENIFIVGDKFYQHIKIDINFTPLPWLPAVLLGLMIGTLIQDYRNKSFPLIGYLGISFLCAWLALRIMNVTGFSSFGSYKLAPAVTQITIMSFFSTAKYPPSLVFFLGTLSFNLLGLYTFFKLEQHAPKIITFLQPLRLFGQCALFFFVTHWFIYYGYSLLFGEKVTQGGSLVCLWLLGIFTLYPLCKRFQQFKLQQSQDSLWRMF